MKKSILLSLACGLGCVGPALGQDPNQAIREEVMGVYSFSPHNLTEDQISQKSVVLDAFWQKVKSQPSVYLPALKSELQKSGAPRFFRYDGSMLLLSLADQPEHRQVALQAMAGCDLRDVQPTDYLRQVHRLATRREDTTAAAFHILSDPKFQAFIPQHALMLGQDYSLIYMLLPTDPAYWLQPAMRRLGVEADPTARKSLLLLLWYAQTKESDRALADFAAAAGNSNSSRDYARDLLARRDKAVVPIPPPKQSEETIRDTRRHLMKVISDEALIELDEKTMQLVAVRR